jgi:hypothetical protein
LECPKQSLLIVGRNLFPVFGYNFARSLTYHTNKPQLTTLSQTVQSKDCTAASRMHFAHAPQRQHGLRSYPLYFSDSKHSRGKTLVFPQLRQFSVPPLCCQMNFRRMMSFQLILLSKIFPKYCIFQLLLCLGSILAPSCQLSCSPPPSSGSVGVASFHPFSRSAMAPRRFCTMAPAPSPSESGHRMRWWPSVALRPAWQRMPRLAARVAAADSRARAQPALLQPSGSRFQTRWFLHLLILRRCHKTVPELFSYPARRFLHAGTGGAFTASTDAVPVPSMGTAQEDRPLTSSPSSRGQSSGGVLWRAVYTPGDHQTSRVYSTSLYSTCV